MPQHAILGYLIEREDIPSTAFCARLDERGRQSSLAPYVHDEPRVVCLWSDD